jgi:hypothetical protein
MQERSEQTKRARDVAREKTEQALNAWSAAVESRDRRRKNIGLMLAAVGAVVGVLLLFWASRTHGFWEKLFDGLGEAMLVAATVEVAARIVRRMINAPKSREQEDWRAYLNLIGDDVSAISTDLALASIEQEAARLSASDRKASEQKAHWEDRRDAYMAHPTKSPTDEKFIQIYTRLLDALPPVPGSHYYRARAELETDKAIEMLRRRKEQSDESTG